jgi:hypothetical protein
MSLQRSFEDPEWNAHYRRRPSLKSSRGLGLNRVHRRTHRLDLIGDLFEASGRIRLRLVSRIERSIHAKVLRSTLRAWHGRTRPLCTSAVAILAPPQAWGQSVVPETLTHTHDPRPAALAKPPWILSALGRRCTIRDTGRGSEPVCGNRAGDRAGGALGPASFERSPPH